MQQTIRVFIAIELPEVIREKLGNIQKKIQTKVDEPARRSIRWVQASNIHLTLKFMGEIEPSRLKALTEVLEIETAKHHSFQMTFGGLGAFPNFRRPRVIWVGSQNPPELIELQKGIDHVTHQLGYESEQRPFSPHLTLGRVAQYAKSDDLQILTQVLNGTTVDELGLITVNKIQLFRSDLRPGGAVYTSLSQFGFALE